METVVPSRFNGPDGSGNGGYAAGCLAGFIDGPAQVRLVAPPPLDRTLEVRETDSGVLALDAGKPVMEAQPATLDVRPPEPVSLEAASEATSAFPGLETHGAPSCFVCGPDREAPDGLRIFPGPVAGRDVVAAPWRPHESLADAKGVVPDVVVWAVLDCPGAWAGVAFEPDDPPFFPALGSVTVAIDDPIMAGEPLIVMAWHLGTEGRKIHTEAAIYALDGTVKARARHVEIKVAADWASD